MCPVLMFAVNRKDRVIGRTKILSVSTFKRNLFNHPGAPLGISLAMKDDKLLVIEEIIKVSHRHEATGKARTMWEDELKIYGINLRVLIKIRVLNRAEMIEVILFKCVEKVLVAWWVIKLMGRESIIVEWGGVAHNEENSMKIIVGVVHNRMGETVCNELQPGSKDEKISNIIIKI